MNGDLQRIRRRLYEILEVSAPGDVASRIFDLSLIVLIVGNVITFALDTVPSIHAKWGAAINLFSIVSGFLFTLEYLLRLWICVEFLPYRRMPAWRARLRFMGRPLLLVDLLVVATFWLSALVPYDLRVLRMFRLFVFLKVMRYSPALQTLRAVVEAEWRALTSALAIMLTLILIAATGIYFIEGDDQPDVFGSVPAAAWWAVTTLTTVGFGDVVPVTAAGKFFGGLIMIFGLGVFALPIGIIASGFAQQVHRREFVITWTLVAKVPLFSQLDPDALNRIVRLIHGERVPRGHVLLEPGDTVDRMVFVVDGTLEVETDARSFDIEEGGHFGEHSLLQPRKSAALVRAKEMSRLLSLSAADMQHLMRRHPKIHETIMHMAHSHDGEAEQHYAGITVPDSGDR